MSVSNVRDVIPHWFLEDNVKTATDLSAAPDQIDFCTCADCEKIKADDDSGGADVAEEECPDKAGHSAGKDGGKELHDSWSSALAKELCPDVLHYSTFAVLRDLTAAAFVADRDGKLIRAEASAVVFRMENEESSIYMSPSFIEPVWMGRAVERVAKALGVSLVSLDLEDLEELGEAQEAEEAQGAEDVENNKEDASSEQQQWQPDVCSLSAFLSHFFGARAERHATAESWQRTQVVWTLIFDAVRNKVANKSTASEMKGGISRSSAVIFHITDYRYVEDYNLKRRVLTRFAWMVQQRREKGDAVVMILSTQDSALESGGKLQRKIGAGPGSTMVVKMTDPDFAIREQSYRGALNVRALKHCLREYCGHLFPTDLLKVTADRTCAELGKSFRAFGGTLWTPTDMDYIVTQIMGRAWLKPELRFADIRAVLSREGCYNPDEPETADAPEKLEKSEFEDNDKSNTNMSEETTPDKPTPEATTPGEATPEEDVSEFLRDLGLNDAEQTLTQYMVHPESLKTGWDDVIVDQESKELMQQFVASPRLQFDCASEFLRHAMRIRGALLYGPPGTGKTELGRAVAKASGSRMLALSYASLASKWTGETEKYIEAAFTLAAKLHPCVLFIDEVDSLFYRRSSSDGSSVRSQINEFLQQMDGLPQSDKAPLVLVATNRPWDLDEAFLRRLQHKVYLGLPDIDARARILGLFLHQDDLDPTVDINGLAQVTEKYSGSDLKTLCAKAGLLWEAEQARLHTLYKSVSEKFATASEAPKKVQLGIDHFAKALDEIQPSNSEGLAEDLETFLRKHNPTASTSGKDPGIRVIYKSSTKQHDRLAVRTLISKPPVLGDIPAPKKDDLEDGMQLQTWCQLDLHAHLVHRLRIRLAVLLFWSPRVLEYQMQVQAWCQLDLRTHLMQRLHTNLAALLFCFQTCGYSLANLQQAALGSEDARTTASNSKTRQKTRKTRSRKKSKPKERAPSFWDPENSTTAGSKLAIREKTKKAAREDKSKLEESASAADTVNSHYASLGTDEFRLLEIAPGDTDDPLVCTLRHTSFQSDTWYCALSYTWGLPEPPFFINCDGSDIRVTRSLHEALHKMRKTWCSVLIWADAICINQSDNSEKSQQVMRMGEIYRKASRLFIWLGNPFTASDADVAVSAVEKLGSIAVTMRAKYGKDLWDPFVFDVMWQEKVQAEAISENEWQKVRELLLMPWFSRVWVFQEVASVMAVSPANIRVGYGNRFVGWIGVVTVMAIPELFKTVNPISIRCPTAMTMERELFLSSMVRKVNFYLPTYDIASEEVAEALAQKSPPDGNFLETGEGLMESRTAVCIVIDLCRLNLPNSGRQDYHQLEPVSIRDASLIVEAFACLYSPEFRAMCKKRMKNVPGVLLDGLAESALGSFYQASDGDEWWLPGKPALLQLRRFVGYITAASVNHRRGLIGISVGLKTATFSYMPGVVYSLWSRMELARRLEATDLRDKLYAFLGMFSEDVADEPLLQVDYNLSVADVYVNLTIYFLQRLMCLDVLEFVNDMPTKKPRLANLPSWAIDLSSPTDLEPFGVTRTFNAGGAIDLGTARLSMHALLVHVSDDRRRLHLNAFIVGDVTELAFLPHHCKQEDHLTSNADRNDHGDKDEATSRTYGLALNMIDRLGQGGQKWKDANIANLAPCDFPTSATFNMPSRLYLTGQSMSEVFWHCLLCSYVPVTGTEAAEEQGTVYRDYRTMIEKGFIPLGPEQDEDAASECFGSPDPTPTEPININNWFSMLFEPIAQTRVFGVVADELIGWFPRRAQKGDMLVVFPGARCPYVLRKVRRDAPMDSKEDVNQEDAAQEQYQWDEWEVIGHAFVQGLMTDIVASWRLELTENGKKILGKLNDNGEAPVMKQICLV